MRIIVHGQQAFGKSVLEALLDRGEDVIGVYCEPDREGRPPDPIKQCAMMRGLPVFQPRSCRKPETAGQMASLRPDLCVMAYVTLFVPEEVLNVPVHGSIQYHPSLLPRHRGGSSINWPVIWGETRTGLSIFWPDAGLDEGPILMQKEVEITDDDTLGSRCLPAPRISCAGSGSVGQRAHSGGVDHLFRVEADHRIRTVDGAGLRDGDNETAGHGSAPRNRDDGSPYRIGFGFGVNPHLLAHEHGPRVTLMPCPGKGGHLWGGRSTSARAPSPATTTARTSTAR